MADRDRPQPHQIQVHPQFGKPHQQQQRQGPSVTKILTVMSLLPIGGTLLTLAGLTLAGTITGLAVCTPLFILFSPVLVPAAIVIGLAVTGILTSGACGLTGISSLSWLLNYIRSASPAEQAKRRVLDATGYVGQKTKEAGQTIQSKAQEAQSGGRT